MYGINIPENIWKIVHRGNKLYQLPNHPLTIIYQTIIKQLPDFHIEDSFDPIVSIENNFDSLRIPKDHPSRSFSDTFYYDEKNVLRTHTSAHQIDLLKAGHEKFLVVGDVYRKDTTDATHYPVFHQMEGVSLIENPEIDLKETLKKILNSLFPKSEWRLNPDYFPFTEPSFEAEVKYQGKWLEVLGCGIIHSEVLENAGIKNKTGWAFGLGLERLAMILFNIPDIRLFWSEDDRFLSQFKENEISEFKTYSKHPVCYKDIAFWIPETYNVNDFSSLVQSIAGNSVESIVEIDKFQHPIKGTSLCYRINFQHLDRSLTNDEVNEMLLKIHKAAESELKVQVRK